MLATDEDHELSFLGLRRAAGDRRIEDERAFVERRLGQAARQSGGDGARVDDDGSGPRRGQRTVGPFHHGLGRRVVGDGHEDDVGTARDRGGRGGDRRTALLQRACALQGPVEHGEVVASGKEPARHATAHGSQADEPEPRSPSPVHDATFRTLTIP